MKIAFNAFIEKEPDSSLSQRGKVSTQVPAVLLSLYQPLVAVPLHIHLIKGIIYHGHINWFVLKPDCISEEIVYQIFPPLYHPGVKSDLVFLSQVEAWSPIQIIRDFILLQTLCINF